MYGQLHAATRSRRSSNASCHDRHAASRARASHTTRRCLRNHVGCRTNAYSNSFIHFRYARSRTSRVSRCITRR